MRLTLANGRRLSVTGDHLLRMKDGWKRADEVGIGEKAACQPFIGVPPTGRDAVAGMAPGRPLPVDVPTPIYREALAGRGLFPLALDNPKLPPLLRLLGSICGDGHLSRDKKRISIYTTHEADAGAIHADFARLGYEARISRRKRYETRKGEIHVYVNSVALHALLAGLGAPVGKKEWGSAPIPWLFGLPGWARAQFLSGFCSAEALTPRIGCCSIPNLAIKQTGEDENAIQFIARLFESLCYRVSTAPSGPSHDRRQDYVLQILGGAAEQLRVYEEIGFCYASEKRLRAAEVASVTWALNRHLRSRRLAREAAVELREAGTRYREVIAQVCERHGVSPGFVHHALYDQRGQNRRERGLQITPDTTGEICWVPVEQIEDGGAARVYDVVTSDPAQCFFAEGAVVHNCGNKAVLTDVPAAEVQANIRTVMDDIWKNLSFGIGRNNETRVEHELFDDPAWMLRPVNSLKQMAQNQLGTIGSGVSRLAW